VNESHFAHREFDHLSPDSPVGDSSRVLSRVSPQTGETSPAAGQVSVVADEDLSGFAEVLFVAGEVSSVG
jgi:hypothetical protein